MIYRKRKGIPSGKRLAGFCFLLLSILGAAPVVAGPPKRVVSLSPNITESVFALGAGDLLVGVSDFCDYPPQVRSLKRCGAWSNTNYEVLSVLHPDLILVLGRHEKVREFGKERGIAVEGVNMDSAVTITSELLRLGRLLGREDAATSLTSRINAELAALKADLDKQPNRHHPSVLISIGRKPNSLADILTATGGSFLDEAITLAGGKNVFGDIRQYYPQVSKETIIVRRPEVILELTGGTNLTADQNRALIDDWKILPSIPAVQNGRIYVLPESYLSIPGPRVPQIVRRFRDVLYPDLAAKAKPGRK